MVVRLVFTVFVLTGALVSTTAWAAGRTCEDLSCGENAICVMVDEGPRCTCQFGFERDRQRRACVPLDRPATRTTLDQIRNDACTPDNVASVESVLGGRLHVETCERLRTRYKDPRLSYGDMLIRRYEHKRTIGYGLMFLVTPIFAGPAIYFGWAMYQINHQDEPGDGAPNLAAGFGYMFYTWALGVCVAAGSFFLFYGLGLVLRSYVMLDRLEPFAPGDESAASEAPRLAVAPFVDPSGAGGAALRVVF